MLSCARTYLAGGAKGRCAEGTTSFFWAEIANPFKDLPLFVAAVRLGIDRAGPDPKNDQEERCESHEATRRRAPGQGDSERPSVKPACPKAAHSRRGGGR